MFGEPRIRTVGNAADTERNRISRSIVEKHLNHTKNLTETERNFFDIYELEKTPQEHAAIRWANSVSNALMQNVGIEPYNSTDEQFHLFQDEAYKTISKKSANAYAVTHAKNGSVLMNASVLRQSPIKFAATTLHEMLHLKAHLTLEVSGKEEPFTITPYREGVGIQAAQKKGMHGEYHNHFRGLHEAIVATLEQHYLPSVLLEPEFSDEVLEKPHDAEYRKQREVLRYVCEEIAQHFSTQFSNAPKVFSLFIHAHFTGQLLTLARLIDSTFGPGSFRILGNMGTSTTSGQLHLDTLRKARTRIRMGQKQ